MKSISKRLITAFLALLLTTAMTTVFISGVFAGYSVSDSVTVTAVYVRQAYIDLSISGNNTGNVVVPGQNITLANAPQVVLSEGTTSCYVFISIEKTGAFDTYMWFVLDGWTKLSGVDGVYYRTTTDTVGEGGLTFNVFRDNTIYVDETVTRDVISQISSNPISLNVLAYAVDKTTDTPTAASAWAVLQG